MRSIVRVEGKDGIGMFRSAYTTEIIRNTHINKRHSNFNTPYEDGLHMDTEWFCAYKTINQLQEWIQKEELEYLCKELGFNVYLISVTNYQEGDHQVVFTKDSIVEKKCITSALVE